MIGILIVVATGFLAFIGAAGWWLWPISGSLLAVWLWLATAERRRSKRLGPDVIEEERTGVPEDVDTGLESDKRGAV